MGCGKSTRGGVVGFSGYVELGDDGQGVGEGECGVKEEVRDGRGERGRESDLVHSGHQLGHQLVDTSWDAVDTRCLAGQVNYTIAFYRALPNTANAFFGY